MRFSTDFWLALCVLALTGGAALLTRDLTTTGGVQTELGPAFFPWLMVAGMAGFALLLLARSFWRRPADACGSLGNWRLYGKLLLFLAYMIVYATFYVEVGYLVSTGIFFVAAMLTLGERRLAHCLVAPLCITVAVYLLFTKIMHVYIP